MSSDIAISVQNVTKNFRLPHEKNMSVKSSLVSMVKGKNKKTIETQRVLRGVSFDVNKGDFLGIVGRNGSGKSTLLKILSGIYEPTEGKVVAHGKLVPFIELGVGFNPELTGRENVYLNGALLGFSTKQIDGMYDDIVDFAELGEFMDQKLKNYSSGMQVRLAFSVAIKAQGDILVLDEVLAVGDEAFQRKCNDYFYKAKREGRTIILVTHSMESVRQFCNRAILIESGEIKASGNPDKVASQYSDMFNVEKSEPVSGAETRQRSNWPLKLKDINMIQGTEAKEVLRFQEDFEVVIELDADVDYKKVRMAFDLIDQAGLPVVTVNTDDHGGCGFSKGRNILKFDVQNILSNGDYYINLAVRDLESNQIIYREPEVKNFSVIGAKASRYGIAHPHVKMSRQADQ